MKILNNKYIITGLALLAGACSDPEIPTPVTNSESSNLNANFVFINASPDAPSLDLFVDNEKSGESVLSGQTQTVYTKRPIASNGVLANLNLRAKASSDKIGGVLNTSDLIFRSTNNGTNNFQALDSAYYTIIALDTITRLKPLRTLNSGNFGDTTYFSPLTGKLLSVVERAQLPSAEKTKLVALGTVPLGSSDPGGLRFLVVTDQLPLPSTTRLPKPAAAKAAVRFINASPNVGPVTVTVGATTVTSGTLTYPLSFPTFSPSVGSRAGVTYGFQTINSGTFDIVVKSGATEIARLNAKQFDEKSDYTIVLIGTKTGVKTLSVVKNK